MHPTFLPRGRSVATVPVTFVNAATWRELREALDSRARAFVDTAGFEPKAGRHCLLPSAEGGLAGVLFALERPEEPNKDLFWPGALPALLPAGAYRFATLPHDARLAALAFALGAYRFARYRKQDDKELKLELPDNVDGDDLSRILEGVSLARDLINTPANDMGPAELEAAARALAERHGGHAVTPETYAAMISEVSAFVDRFAAEHGPLPGARVHLLGTSGTVTTIAGVHLELRRYERRRVDGCWMVDGDVTRVIERLLSWSYEDRVANACIGIERADLVLAGCAIFDAIRRAFPCERVRVADRGLREGMLVEMMRADDVWGGEASVP